MSDRNTSAPNSWNNFTHRALVSAAVSLFFCARPIIQLVALFLNLVNGAANTCNFSVTLINDIRIRGRQVVVFVAPTLQTTRQGFIIRSIMAAISRGSGYFGTRGNGPVDKNLLFQLCYFLRKSVDFILYIFQSFVLCHLVIAHVVNSPRNQRGKGHEFPHT